MLATVRSELTKLRTLPSVWVVTAMVLALQTIVLLEPGGLIANAVHHMAPNGTIEIFRGHPQPANTAILGLLSSSSLQGGLFLPVIAAVVAGHEFRAGQWGVSVLSVPRRGVLVAAKAIATAICMLVLAVLIAALSIGFMYLHVKDWNPGLVFSADALTGQAAFVAFVVLFSLTTFAITLLARSTLVGIVALAVLVMVTMTQLLATTLPALDALLPLSAARNLLLDPGINVLTASPAEGIVVLVGWALVTVASAAVVLTRRDAR